jgi:hypothetical protein
MHRLRRRDAAEVAGSEFLHPSRLMVFMTFDTDFGDSFERETESPDYFQCFSVPSYEIGSDVLIYALTH